MPNPSKILLLICIHCLILVPTKLYAESKDQSDSFNPRGTEIDYSDEKESKIEFDENFGNLKGVVETPAAMSDREDDRESYSGLLEYVE